MEVDLEQAHSWSWFITAAPSTTSTRGELPFTESCIFKDKETRNPGSQSSLAHT